MITIVKASATIKEMTISIETFKVSLPFMYFINDEENKL